MIVRRTVSFSFEYIIVTVHLNYSVAIYTAIITLDCVNTLSISPRFCVRDLSPALSPGEDLSVEIN